MRFVLITLITIALVGRAYAEEHDHDHDKHADEHGEEHAGHVDEVKLTAAAIENYGIKLASVSMQRLTPTLDAPARVSFNTEAMAHVGAVVKGRATEIKVRVGDAVKKGDELVIVESAELGEAQSDFIQKQTAVEVAAGAVEPAKSAADRAKMLHDQNEGIALGEVQKRAAELKAAQGALQTAEAALKAAENTLKLMGMDEASIKALAKSSKIDPKYAIRAPLDGQVIEREITLGELVSPEKEALLVLANLQTLWVLADVPESRLRHIAVGAKARVQIDAASDEAIEGKVSFIAPALDASTRSAQVRIEVPGANGLRPGMFATAQISAELPTTAPAAAVLAVPDSAVQIVEGGPAVFVPVEGEENTFAKRSITVGKTVGDMTPILSGLKEGEQIVVEGSFILKAELGKSEAAHEH